MAGRSYLHMPPPRSQVGVGGGRKDTDQAASDLFDKFCQANTFHGTMSTFSQLCDRLDVSHSDHRNFYSILKSRLTTWKAQSLWVKLDRRAQCKTYRKGAACPNTRVLIIGAGPCGLRTAIEVAFLGGKSVIVEKRDRFSRNNVLHLWPYLIHDLKALGAKKFFGKFCAGAIDHISIRTLQCILLKIALVVGVEVHQNVNFDGLIEPPDEQVEGEKATWKARVTPADHPVSEFDFEVIIAADGKRNTLEGFKKKEFRGKLAIAITANFINRNSHAEACVEEISGVAFIFNQKFFKDLYEKTGIDLENIVYYKDETHYFVMTAKKQSLLDKGVLKMDYYDTAQLLSRDNVNQTALEAYAREAADVSTNHKLPHLDYAHNHYGQPDVAMFDFTSIYHALHASKVLEKSGVRLLMGLAGDSLLEPFWPTGSGCARGFFGAFDAAWMIRSWASGKMTPLEVLAERESVYQLLSQTTPENTNKNFALYTIDPNTRYKNVNMRFFQPHQVRNLYEGGDAKYIEEIVQLSEQKNKKYEWVRDSHYLLRWLQRQLEAYKSTIRVLDLTTSWRSGIAFCCLIHRYRPELINIHTLDANQVADNNQKAFDLAEKEFGIAPIMTGQDVAQCDVPDKLTMVSYLSQFYDYFRKENIRPAKVTKTPESFTLDSPASRARKSKSPAAKLSALSRIQSRIRHKQDEEKENDKRFRRVYDPQALARKRIRDVTMGEQRSKMLQTYSKFEGLERPAGPKRPAVAERLTTRSGFPSMNVGSKGQNKVSVLAKGLAYKFEGKEDPEAAAAAAQTYQPSKRYPGSQSLVGVSALAKDLATKFRGDVEPPQPQPTEKMNPRPLIMGQAPSAEYCYFCKQRVYLVERHSAEGVFFHRWCLKCEYCGSSLRIGQYSFLRTDNDEAKFYCVQHLGMKKPTKRLRKRRSYDDRDTGPVSVYGKGPVSTSSPCGDEMETGPNLNKTPERIEYQTESEIEESEVEQTIHNLSGHAEMELSESDSDDLCDNELKQFLGSSSDEDTLSDEGGPANLSWEQYASSYRKNLVRPIPRKRRMVPRPEAQDDDDDSGSVTPGGSDMDDDWTDSETEKESEGEDSEEVEQPSSSSKPSPSISGSSLSQSSSGTSLRLGVGRAWDTPPSKETKPSPTSVEVMRNRMAFFSSVSEPIRIDARAFLGLDPDPPIKEKVEEEKEAEVEEDTESKEGDKEEGGKEEMLEVLEEADELEAEIGEKELENAETAESTEPSSSLELENGTKSADIPEISVEAASSEPESSSGMATDSSDNSTPEKDQEAVSDLSENVCVEKDAEQNDEKAVQPVGGILPDIVQESDAKEYDGEPRKEQTTELEEEVPRPEETADIITKITKPAAHIAVEEADTDLDVSEADLDLDTGEQAVDACQIKREKSEEELMPISKSESDEYESKEANIVPSVTEESKVEDKAVDEEMITVVCGTKEELELKISEEEEYESKETNIVPPVTEKVKLEEKATDEEMITAVCDTKEELELRIAEEEGVVENLQPVSHEEAVPMETDVSTFVQSEALAVTGAPYKEACNTDLTGTGETMQAHLETDLIKTGEVEMETSDKLLDSVNNAPCTGSSAPSTVAAAGMDDERSDAEGTEANILSLVERSLFVDGNSNTMAVKDVSQISEIDEIAEFEAEMMAFETSNVSIDGIVNVNRTQPEEKLQETSEQIVPDVSLPSFSQLDVMDSKISAQEETCIADLELKPLVQNIEAEICDDTAMQVSPSESKTDITGEGAQVSAKEASDSYVMETVLGNGHERMDVIHSELEMPCDKPYNSSKTDTFDVPKGIDASFRTADDSDPLVTLEDQRMSEATPVLSEKAESKENIVIPDDSFMQVWEDNVGKAAENDQTLDDFLEKNMFDNSDVSSLDTVSLGTLTDISTDAKSTTSVVQPFSTCMASSEAVMKEEDIQSLNTCMASNEAVTKKKKVPTATLR